MVRQKTTVYLDSDLLTATKAVAASSQRSESAVVEDALRTYFSNGQAALAKDSLGAILDRVSRRTDLDGDSAMALAVHEVKTVRARRRSEPEAGESAGDS